MFQGNLSPERRGWPEGLGEGYRTKLFFMRYPSPAAHLAMGVTLSRRERELLQAKTAKARYNNSCTLQISSMQDSRETE